MNPPTTETADRSGRFRHRLGRRGVVIVLVVVVAATAAGVWGLLRSGSPPPSALVDHASSLATITERTITSQQQVNGTLGFAGATTVLQPVGAAPDAVTEADQKAATAEQSLAQARADRSAAVANLSLVAQAQAKVISAEQSSAAAQSAAEEAHGSALAFGQSSIYTTLPSIGQVVTRGQPLYSISAQPVPLLYGSVTPWRAFRHGMSAGPDVAQLNQNLADLGHGAGLAGSDTFSNATAAAIRTLQRTLGLPKTGQLQLGSIVFQPDAVRVTAVTPKLGAAVQPGAPVLDLTSTTRQITVKLDAAQQSQVKVGDPVTVTLPDNKTTPATVTSVGTVATEPAPSGAGSDPNSQPTVEVDITPGDSAATGNLDAAPVHVSITTASADHALAVPVTALLALSGGGYGVDVVSAGGVHHLEAVTLGLFDDADGLVQISGPTVHAGDQVAVAGS
ncbi:MAG TPA: peptidoglycan-binding protein [Acidimicrobiales bacterium]|nr:peptidoglycan-binding protein [Acidimicrobiales bacterium]